MIGGGNYNGKIGNFISQLCLKAQIHNYQKDQFSPQTFHLSPISTTWHANHPKVHVSYMLPNATQVAI